MFRRRFISPTIPLLRKIHTEKIPLITNEYLPVCSQCKFFIIKDKTCFKFGEKDIISGEIKYKPVRECRWEEPNLCGKEANMFSQMTQIEKITKQGGYIFNEFVYEFIPTIAVTSVLGMTGGIVIVSVFRFLNNT